MISHNRPFVTDSDRKAVDVVLRGGLIAQGPEVEALESKFNAFMGGGASCAVSSGTAALFLALKGLGVGADDVVAVPTYSCSALLNAINMLGGQPQIVDVREDDFTIDPQSLLRQKKGGKGGNRRSLFWRAGQRSVSQGNGAGRDRGLLPISGNAR